MSDLTSFFTCLHKNMTIYIIRIVTVATLYFYCIVTVATCTLEITCNNTTIHVQCMSSVAVAVEVDRYFCAGVKTEVTWDGC